MLYGPQRPLTAKLSKTDAVTRILRFHFSLFIILGVPAGFPARADASRSRRLYQEPLTRKEGRDLHPFGCGPGRNMPGLTGAQGPRALRRAGSAPPTI